MAERWNPWRALSERPHITLARNEIAKLGGGALYGRRGDEAAIVLDPGLTRSERRAALAHELVHDERGGGVEHDPTLPPSMTAFVRRDEEWVDRIVADRLVPLDELEEIVDRCMDLGGTVDVVDIAEQFDVPEHVAERQLRRLTERKSA